MLNGLVGIVELIGWLWVCEVGCVGLEVSGGYEWVVCKVLEVVGFEVVVY